MHVGMYMCAHMHVHVSYVYMYMYMSSKPIATPMMHTTPHLLLECISEHSHLTATPAHDDSFIPLNND